MNIGDNIKTLRKKRRYTQTELAKEVNLSPQMISLIESNSVLPSIISLKKIATALGVKPSFLVRGI